MAKIGFISLGCAKNQVDCERMMYRVQEAGFTVQSDVVGADVVVINTCGFIGRACLYGCRARIAICKRDVRA